MDAVGEGSDGDDIGGRAAEKQKSDGVGGGGRPGYGVRFAGRNLFIETRAGDGVARWLADLIDELEEVLSPRDE